LFFINLSPPKVSLTGLNKLSSQATNLP